MGNSDAEGELSFALTKEGNAIGRDDLNEEDVFVLDAGNTIWVWEGNRASQAERAMWLKVAQKYVRTQQNAKELSVAKVKQGKEGKAFWAAVEA